MSANPADIAQRAALALAALVVCVALAVWLRTAHLESRGERIAKLPQAELDRSLAQEGLADLRAAARRTPDSRPDLLAALLLRRVGRTDAALVELRRIVRREPDNLEVWAWIAIVAERSDHPQLAARALARIRALDPRRAAAAG